MFEGGMPRDEAGMGRARATNPDELPGDTTSEHGSDPQHDDAGSTNKVGPPSPPEIGRAGLHGTTKTGTTRGAASSGPDHAHEQARSGDAFGTRWETVH